MSVAIGLSKNENLARENEGERGLQRISRGEGLSPWEKKKITHESRGGFQLCPPEKFKFPPSSWVWSGFCKGKEKEKRVWVFYTVWGFFPLLLCLGWGMGFIEGQDERGGLQGAVLIRSPSLGLA